MPLSIILQYVLPKQALTILAGKFANLQAGKLTTSVIAWFVKRYQVNMTEAENPDISSYKTFNDFFTRPLKSNARPLAKADFICPVDGAISQFGYIDQDQLFQAKNHNYSSLTLLAGNQALANKFHNGHFACLYLSPKDYHRIHMPCDGTLKSMAYVPGDLFSVNP
ncbi:MAG: phosphatidylserine decarboxylase, partial [Methylotenera sp.]